MKDLKSYLDKHTSLFRDIHFFRAYEPGPFADKYYQVREKEGRIYDDETLKNLPNLPKTHPLYKEWKIREETLRRLTKYLASKPKERRILDIGCGNGWMSNQLAKLPDTQVLGMDKVVPELEQAVRVFGENSDLYFSYGDVFHDIPPASFDTILMVASAQYFGDMARLMAHLRSLLKPEGEIHLLDTHFYDAGEVSAARARTIRYYNKIGFPDLIEFYYCHGEAQLLALGAKKYRDADTGWTKFREKLGMGVASPFSWWIV